MSEVEEYIFFNNSETEFLKTIIQSVDGSYVECNKVRGEIVRNFGSALWIDMPKLVSFSYIEDEDYKITKEANYKDRYNSIVGLSYSDVCD